MRVEKEADLPTMAFADITDARGSYGRLPLTRQGEPEAGTYRLRGRLTAPSKAGHYRIHIEADYAIIDRETGKAEFVHVPSPSVSIEVK